MSQTSEPDPKSVELDLELGVRKTRSGSTWARLRRRFLRHKPAVAGIVVVSILLVLAIFAPVSALGVDPSEPNFGEINNAPKRQACPGH